MTTSASHSSFGRLGAFRLSALFATLLLLLGLSLTASAQITLPWHEPFAYANVGAKLGDGASNGNPPWGNGNKDSQRFAAGSLSYPAFALSSSNKVAVTVAGSGAINDFNEARPEFANVGPSHGSVLYLSFLMNIRDFANISATSPGNAIMGFTAAGGTVRYGSINLWSDGGNIKVGAVKYNGATTVSSSTFFASTVATNTTYVVVLKYQYDTNTASDDVVTVWLNPASSSFGIGGSEDAGNKVSTSAGADGLSGLRRCYLLDGFNVDVDEVRIGTSWQAVMPSACDAPLFFTQPQSATNVVGGATYFLASAGGTANVYQWRRAGTNLIDGGNISGANSATLSINPVGSGDAANYDLVVTNACSGQSVTSSVATLTIVSGANLVWSGDGSLNQWDQTTANWNGNTATFADFDSVTFDDTSVNTTVTLTNQQNPGRVTVNTTSGYTLTGSPIGGVATVVKTNTGSLTLSSANSYLGRTIINQGTLSIGNENRLGANPPIFVADQLTLDGGTLQASGASVTIDDSNRGILLGAAGGTFESGFGAPLTLRTPVTGSGQLVKIGPADVTLDKANTYTGGTVVTAGKLLANQLNALGTGDVTIESGATLFMSFGENGHSNNIVAKSGSTLEYRYGGSETYALVLRGALTSPPGSSITIYQNNSGTGNARLRLYGTFTNTADIVLATAGGNLLLSPHNPNLGEQVFSGAISGVGEVYGRGSIVLGGQSTFNRADASYSVRMSGNGCTIGIGADSTPTSGTVTSSPLGAGSLAIGTSGDSGTGTLLAWGGARTVANPIYYTYATNTVTLVLGGTNNLTLSGPIELALATDTQGTNRTLNVVNTAATTLSGVVSDNGLPSGIIKTGSGSLYLDGANAYTGTTAINAGLLAGAGSVAGPVTVGASGTVGAGSATAIGNLTVNNDLTLSGNVAARVNRAGFLSDLLSVSGALTNAGAGTVTVSNLGAALQINDTFTLFNKALTNGAALAITGGGMVWSNRLALDGTIVALTTFATTPTNLTTSVSGNTLTLSWPLNYQGWSVQSNAVSVASPASWFTIPGSAGTTALNITIDPAQTNVFYRMSLP